MRLEIRVVRREMRGFMIDLDSSIHLDKDNSLLFVEVEILLRGG
jgi:hypothetical protein